MNNLHRNGATITDQCAHRLMDFTPDPEWHGSTVDGDFIAYYHESRLFSVRRIGKEICCLVRAGGPGEAIDTVRRALK